MQRNYYIEDDTIKLSHIVGSLENDVALFKLSQTKHIKRIKADELLKILKKYGYKDFSSPYPYIQFNKISPIDTSKIHNFLEKYYTEKYKTIDIKKITLEPRSYMENMPKNYTIDIRSHEHLSRNGVVAIKTQQNKMIFFNYIIQASITVLTLKNDLSRNSELSKINTLKNSIILDKFNAMPLQEIEDATWELKHSMKKGEIITDRDVTPLEVIKRDANVNVMLQNGSILITFSAKALQSGCMGDTIFVENNKGKKIRVIVIGKNRAKIK
ncbi:flagellar basal body P-ring formation chaperone FlgA [Sulfurimonas sp.]|uniref:flagellar basal body P-ring formation chaperone FlgA n=1 Tax=Sulfurimonas sp. TaxID=2022749 RepID=UPI003D121849